MELYPFKRGGTPTPGGVDYSFATMQSAFTACDVLRRWRLPYELNATPAGRYPWYSDSKEFCTGW